MVSTVRQTTLLWSLSNAHKPKADDPRSRIIGSAEDTTN